MNEPVYTIPPLTRMDKEMTYRARPFSRKSDYKFDREREFAATIFFVSGRSGMYIVYMRVRVLKPCGIILLCVGRDKVPLRRDDAMHLEIFAICPIYDNAEIARVISIKASCDVRIVARSPSPQDREYILEARMKTDESLDAALNIL